MAQLEAKDKVQWRAGDTPKASHLRTGVIKEVLTGGLCLVSTKVDGATIIEEIRMVRLKPVEVPAAAPKKQAGKPAAAPKKQTGKPAAKKGRRKAKKAGKTEKADKAEKPAAVKKAKKSKKKAA